MASPLEGLVAPVTSQPLPYELSIFGFPRKVLTQWPRWQLRSKLVRGLTGHFHVSLLQQVALTQYGKERFGHGV